MAPEPVTRVLTSKRKRCETQRHKEAEVGAKPLETKGCWPPPEGKGRVME